jgi:hypothetical protein
MARSTVKSDAALTKLEARAANLKIAKIKSEREFIDARGKKVTPGAQAAIQKRRDTILFQLELEGAEIERELVVAYRRKLSGLGMTFLGLGLETATGCPFCTTCVTSCLECVTSCTACVACSNDVF